MELVMMIESTEDLTVRDEVQWDALSPRIPVVGPIEFRITMVSDGKQPIEPDGNTFRSLYALLGKRVRVIVED